TLGAVAGCHTDGPSLGGLDRVANRIRSLSAYSPGRLILAGTKHRAETGSQMAVQVGSRTESLLAMRDTYVARGVSLAPIVADHAHGARLVDVDGKEYIDFAGGIGVLNIGHTPDAVVAAIKEQADALLHSCFPVAAYEPYLEVSKLLCEHSPGTHAKKAVL